MEALRTEQPTMCRMQDGIELAKGQLRAILNTINSQIETNNIINAGPFLYMNMKESPDNHMFAHPVSIRLLCKLQSDIPTLILSSCVSPPLILPIPAKTASWENPSSSPGSCGSPWRICVSLKRKVLEDHAELNFSPGKKLVCGCPPLGSTSNKNPFGKAFKEAGARSQARIDYQFMGNS